MLSVACSCALLVPAYAVQTNHTPELAERYEFITRAMAEQDSRDYRLCALLPESNRALCVASTAHLVLPGRLVPFADWDFYTVTGTIVWEPNTGQKWERVLVPQGFVTDLATIPRVFWQVLRPTGRYAYAAVVHDYLYWTQRRSREEADEIFRVAMEDSKVDAITVETLYQAVRQFGQGAWDANARLRKAGECRFLSRLPTEREFTVSWSEWKRQPDVFPADCNR